jgi:hypothetical protein
MPPVLAWRSGGDFVVPAAFLVALPARLGRRGVSGEDLLFSTFGYHLDESDPDVAILCRQDGSFVAASSERRATREGIVEAAKAGYRELLRVHRIRRGEAAEKHKIA